MREHIEQLCSFCNDTATTKCASCTINLCQNHTYTLNGTDFCETCHSQYYCSTPDCPSNGSLEMGFEVCPICNKSFCISCLALCEECYKNVCINDAVARENGGWRCVECDKKCSVDGCSETDIAGTCQNCGKMFCAEHLTLQVCRGCSNEYCLDCLPLSEHNCSLVNLCEVEGCDEIFSTLCIGCNKQICSEHSNEKDGDFYCPDCYAAQSITCAYPGCDATPAIYTCSESDCTGKFCKAHACICVACDKSFCAAHVIQCPTCDDLFCSSCYAEHNHEQTTDTCSICGKEKNITCETCNRVVCVEHTSIWSSGMECIDCESKSHVLYTCDSCGRDICEVCSMRDSGPHVYSISCFACDPYAKYCPDCDAKHTHRHAVINCAVCGTALCGEADCNEHGESHTCAYCSTTFCTDCWLDTEHDQGCPANHETETCVICGAIICEGGCDNHGPLARCMSCEKPMCVDCLTQKHTCSCQTCGNSEIITYCGECSDALCRDCVKYIDTDPDDPTSGNPRCPKCYDAQPITCDKCTENSVSTCSNCGINLCMAHQNVQNDVVYCDDCYMEFGSCSVDGCTNSKEYFCGTCGKSICETHAYLYNGTVYCNEHYPKCESSGCYNVQSGNTCSACGNAICSICTLICDLCGKVYCLDHVQSEQHNCPAAGHEVLNCADCNIEICNHGEEPGLCEIADANYCELCKKWVCNNCFGSGHSGLDPSHVCVICGEKRAVKYCDVCLYGNFCADCHNHC